jgi:hypothetical protein
VEDPIRLNRIDDVLADLEYPIAPSAVVDACGETTVRLVEGTVSIGKVIEQSNADRFESSGDLEMEMMSLLGSADGSNAGFRRTLVGLKRA